LEEVHIDQQTPLCIFVVTNCRHGKDTSRDSLVKSLKKIKDSYLFK